MKRFFSALKQFFIALLYLALVLLIVELLLYFTTPVYDFARPQPFSGHRLYNPYAGMDSSAWRKCNFHFHNRAWGGMTAGRHNSYREFYRIYKSLGYDAPEISNYQQIDKHFSDSSFYIPCYEHGFGVRKKHQLLIGAREVLWLDYSLYQNLNNKQHILDLLHSRSDLVAIAHPDWEHGYTAEDLKYLSRYDLMEVLDQNWRSVPLWDAALSAGHPAFIVADDDSHDVESPMHSGVCCTFVNSGVISRDSLEKALKEGKAFGADIYVGNGETMERKAEKAKHLPVLESVTLRGDTLRIRTGQKALKFTFIGQNGRIRKLVRFTDEAWYVVRPEDPYIRTEIRFYNEYRGPGTTYYLNPVIRYNGDKPASAEEPEINWVRTWIFRLFSIPSLFVLIGLVWYYRRRKAAVKPQQHE
ncbi:MAG TPA: hypothetical protein VMC08_05285 [Bacteroidales bacterium]|nr:hypothetical protein [Bacteroidales bacterium]